MVYCRCRWRQRSVGGLCMLMGKAVTAACCGRLAEHSHDQMTWLLSLICTVCWMLQQHVHAFTLQCFRECDLCQSGTTLYDTCGSRYRKVGTSTIDIAISTDLYKYCCEKVTACVVFQFRHIARTSTKHHRWNRRLHQARITYNASCSTAMPTSRPAMAPTAILGMNKPAGTYTHQSNEQCFMHQVITSYTNST